MATPAQIASAFDVVRTVGAAGAAIAAAPAAYRLYNSAGAMANQFQSQITYPSDLIQSNRDFYISLRFIRYEKRTIQNSPFLRDEGTIRLPLPDNLKDISAVSYGTPSLGPMVGAGLEAISGQQIAGSTTAETITNSIGAILETAGAGAQGAAANALSTGVGGQAAQAYFGVAVNPFQTVLFEKPEFKKHSFTWKLLPKTEKESDDARNIIRTLQYHMHPGVDESYGIFFSYPSRVVLSLYPSSQFLYRFKPCVITGVTVNYASGSAPSFFKRTQAPTAITLSVSLMEIEYWTNKDFTAQAFSDDTAVQNLYTTMGNLAIGEVNRNRAEINSNAIVLPNN